VVTEMSLELVPRDGVDSCMGVTVCLQLPLGPWLVRRWWGEFAGTPPNETGVMVEVEVFVTGELVD
jgi:hypothetical protein